MHLLWCRHEINAPVATLAQVKLGAERRPARCKRPKIVLPICSMEHRGSLKLNRVVPGVLRPGFKNGRRGGASHVYHYIKNMFRLGVQLSAINYD